MQYLVAVALVCCLGCGFEDQPITGVDRVLRCGEHTVAVFEGEIEVLSVAGHGHRCSLRLRNPAIACTGMTLWAAGQDQATRRFIVRRQDLATAACDAWELEVTEYHGDADVQIVALSDDRALLLAIERDARMVDATRVRSLALNTFPIESRRAGWTHLPSSLRAPILHATMQDGRTAVAHTSDSVLYVIDPDDRALEEVLADDRAPDQRTVQFYGALRFPSPITDVIVVESWLFVIAGDSLCRVESASLPHGSTYDSNDSPYQVLGDQCWPITARRLLGVLVGGELVLETGDGELAALHPSHATFESLGSLPGLESLCRDPVGTTFAVAPGGVYRLDDTTWRLQAAGVFTSCARFGDGVIAVDGIGARALTEDGGSFALAHWAYEGGACALLPLGLLVLLLVRRGKTRVRPEVGGGARAGIGSPTETEPRWPPWLGADELGEAISAAARHELQNRRRVLLGYLPEGIPEQLEGLPVPADQLRRDLQSLNRMSALADGKVALQVWLLAAIGMLDPIEAPRLEAALRLVVQRMERSDSAEE